MFTPLKKEYDQFVPAIDSKEKIKELIDASLGKEKAFAKYTEKLKEFWKQVLPKMESLPSDKSVYDFTKHCTAAFSTILSGITNPLLSEFQLRGSFAQYTEDLKYDFKSVAASAWKAELIPDDEILESQFPEVLENYRFALARREELEALFETVNELEEGEWNDEEYAAIPKKIISDIKSQIKQNTKQKNLLNKELTKISKQIKAYEKDLNGKVATSETKNAAKVEIDQLTAKATDLENEIALLEDAIFSDTDSIKKHIDLEEELKTCRTQVKELIFIKGTLVEEARAKISEEEAKTLILARWERTLHAVIRSYQENHTRNLIFAIEGLFEKYTTTLEEVLSSREKETQLLDNFLIELGYE